MATVNVRHDIAAILRQHANIKVAWLFGSVARGDESFESDLDVAVLGPRSLTTSEKLRLIEELADLCGRPVDLVDLQATHGAIVGKILKKGTRLFCEDSSLYAELIKRWVFYEADFMPYRRRILQTRLDAWIRS